jgi:two-component system response regulator AtoC
VLAQVRLHEIGPTVKAAVTYRSSGLHTVSVDDDDVLLDDEPTSNVAAAAGNERLQLIVHVDDSFSTFRLRSAGEVAIGRGAASDVKIEHLSISRAHAVLSIGPTLRIRDVGSANGTRVAGQRIEPNVDVVVATGDPITVGAAMVMVQRVAAAAPSRRVQSHEYFEPRIEEECARRRRNGGTFAILRVNVAAEIAAADVEDALHRALRAHDVLALYAPHQYEVFVDGASPSMAAQVADRLRTQLGDAAIAARIGLACYPNDGATAGALSSHANDAVAGRTDPAMRVSEEAEVAEASAMAGVHELVARVASSTISVLILGETGVGKEMLAESVHRQSPRADKTFLRLNCAALSESLLESELFGHERGAFTGAVAQKRGLLETADGGTVFLDEIGELPLSTQVKLLRVIEERTVTRVGGLTSRSLDVRFVAATNRDLEVEVARGVFRQDLFFRLNGITVVIPPLRERRSEIEKLAHTFLATASRDRKQVPRLSADALQILQAYSWPGNIRELRNVIERAALLSTDGEIAPRHLPTEKINAPVTARASSRVSLPPRPPLLSGVAAPATFGDNATDSWPIIREGQTSTPGLKGELEALERQRILDALERCAWNQTKAARMLELPRGQLMARLDQYGIARPRKKTEP